MKLKGIHLLLTYQRTMECDHCFVWSRPSAQETMTFKQINELLIEAEKLGKLNGFGLKEENLFSTIKSC